VIGGFDAAGRVDRSVGKSLAFELVRVAGVDAVQSQIRQNEGGDHPVSSAMSAKSVGRSRY